MNRKGQSLIVLCLGLSAVVLVLTASILVALDNKNQQVIHLKKRILGQNATIQLSYILVAAYSEGQKYPLCNNPSFSGATLMVVSGNVLCLPPPPICVGTNFRYCLANSGGLMITDYRTPVQDMSNQASWSLPFRFDFSVLPTANAQSAPWLPSLGSAPSAQVSVVGLAADRYVKCEPAALWNSKCFRIRVCINGSQVCPSQDDYFETIVAIQVQKI